MTTKSLGQRFAESEVYLEAQQKGARRTGDFKFGSFWETETKDLALSPDSSGGALARSVRVPGLVVPGDRRLFVRDLIPSTQLTEGSLEFVQETGFGAVATQLNGAHLATATVLTVDSTAGFQDGSEINIAGTERTIASIDSATQITITAQLGAAKADNDPVRSKVVAPTAEGALKPLGDMDFELKEAFPRVIASGIRASRQVLSDGGQLQTHVDTRLRYALGLSEEFQLLFGSGSGEELQGLLADANRSTLTALAGGSIADTIRRAVTVAEDAGYPATGAVLNNHDWETVELSKSPTDDHYLFLQSLSAGVSPVMWRLPVVSTPAMPQGRAAVGAFALAAEIHDREQSNIRIADQHEDMFLRNQVIILGEERIALANYRPEAIVDVDLTP